MIDFQDTSTLIEVIMTQRSLIITFGIHQALHWLSLGILIPVLVLIQQAKGLSLLEVGSVMAVYGIVVILLEVPTGSLADLHGRKRIYLIATAVNLLSTSMLLFVSSFSGVMAALIVYGISRALNSGSMDAWFVDEFNRVSPDGNLQRALAVIEVAVLIALGIGSLLGGYLPDGIGAILEPYRLLDRYSGNILAALGIMLLQLCYTASVIREHELPQAERRSMASQLAASFKFSISHRTILLLLLTTLTLGIGFSTMETFWQPRVREIGGEGLPSLTFGILSAGYFIAAAIGSLVIIPIARRFKDAYPRLLALTRILFGIGFIMLARQSGLYSFACWYFILFSFNGASSSPHNALLNSKVPSEKRSTILSLSSLALQAGGAIGSLAGGIISERFGIPVTWVAAGILLILSSGLYLAVRTND